MVSNVFRALLASVSSCGGCSGGTQPFLSCAGRGSDGNGGNCYCCGGHLFNQAGDSPAGCKQCCGGSTSVWCDYPAPGACKPPGTGTALLTTSDIYKTITKLSFNGCDLLPRNYNGCISRPPHLLFACGKRWPSHWDDAFSRCLTESVLFVQRAQANATRYKRMASIPTQTAIAMIVAAMVVTIAHAITIWAAVLDCRPL